MKSCIKLILTILIAAFNVPSSASVGTGFFNISGIYVSLAENYHMRVYGTGSIAGCTAGVNWAYMNTSYPGSKEYFAALMLAYATNKQVNLVVQPDGNGYCQIIEMTY